MLREILALALFAVSGGSVKPSNVTYLSIADSTTTVPGGEEPFSLLTFPRAASDQRCYFLGMSGKADDGSQKALISKQYNPLSRGARGIEVVADTHTDVPGAPGTHFETLQLMSGEGNCFIGTSPRRQGVYCRDAVVACNQSSEFTAFAQASDWGSTVVFTASVGEGWGIYMAVPAVGTTYTFTTLADTSVRPFARNTSAPLTFFGSPSAVGGRVAFFASHTTDSEYRNVHEGLFVNIQGTLQLLVEDHVTPVPAGNGTLCYFSDLCLGTTAAGESFVAFVAIGSQGGKGVYVHYATRNATRRIADLTGRSPQGYQYRDFPYPPSCSGKGVAFYADTTGSASGVYFTTIPDVPLPEHAVWPVFNVVDVGTRINGQRLLPNYPPKAAVRSLASQPNGDTRLCFYAQYDNGTFGVFAADFPTPRVW